MIVEDKYNDILKQAWTFISRADKFGSAWADGSLQVTMWWPDLRVHETVKYRCRSHRQAVRQLRRWVRGQGITARRVS